MFASQLIYTACGKGRTGAFSVWSKSADITKTESDEITKMMVYKRPADLPYEPTDEELERLFPKKFGYFILSSGRYCIAQSTYIGRVYSNLDMRSGNYMIHAFVLEDLGNILPMTFFGSNIFKTKLTEDEWLNNEAPEELPKIDLAENTEQLSKSDIDKFFTGDNSRRFELLLQASLSACFTDEKVTFYDSDANLKYWYKALSLCLPRGIQKKMTFCSFHTPTMTVSNPAMTSVGTGPEIKIQNVAPTVMSSVFSYDQEIRNGRYAFNFAGNLFNENIPLSKYIKLVVKSLHENLFNTLMMVDSIDKLMEDGSRSIEDAASLYNLQKGNYEWFDTLDELIATIEQVPNAIPESITAVADSVYHRCVEKESWEYSPDLLSVYRFVFDHSEKASKSLIVERYIENRVRFGISDLLSCEEFTLKMIENAPFTWANFVNFLFEEPEFKKYFRAIGHSFNSEYLVYITLVNAMKDLTDAQKDASYRYFVEMMIGAIKEESVEQINMLLGGIRTLGEKWESWLVKNSLAMLTRNGAKVTDVCNSDFLLELVKVMSSQGIALLILKQIAAENINNDKFVSKYVSVAQTAKEKFERYEDQLRSDAAVSAFVDSADMLRFASKPASKKDLDKYYRLYYKNGKDRGLFRKQLKDFLPTVPNSEIIDLSRELYTTWFEGLPDTHPDLVKCVSDLSRCIFDVHFEQLIKYAEKRGIGAFTPILKRLYDNGVAAPSKYSVLKLGMDAKGFSLKIPPVKGGVNPKDIMKKLDNRTFYAALTNPADIDLFVSYFMQDVLNMHLDIAQQGEFEVVLEACLSDISESRKFGGALIEAVEKMDKRVNAQMLTDIFSYAHGQSTPLAKTLRSVINYYLDECPRGKRKKIFAAVIDGVTPEYEKKVKNFIDKYQKEHESFFERLFASKNEPREKGERKSVKEDKKQFKK